MDHIIYISIQITIAQNDLHKSHCSNNKCTQHEHDQCIVNKINTYMATSFLLF